jgi:4a-hydroxytetrahydrobiopterin dehydratase
MSNYQTQTCRNLTGANNALDEKAVHAALRGTELAGWMLERGQMRLRKEARFADFSTSLAFVNRLAAMAEAENHHPDLELGFGYVVIHYATHDVGGISINDLICAAKCNALLNAFTQGR